MWRRTKTVRGATGSAAAASGTRQRRRPAAQRSTRTLASDALTSLGDHLLHIHIWAFLLQVWHWQLQHDGPKNLMDNKQHFQNKPTRIHIFRTNLLSITEAFKGINHGQGWCVDEYDILILLYYSIFQPVWICPEQVNLFKLEIKKTHFQWHIYLRQSPVQYKFISWHMMWRWVGKVLKLIWQKAKENH